MKNLLNLLCKLGVIYSYRYLTCFPDTAKVVDVYITHKESDEAL